LEEAAQEGIIEIKGHRSRGGCRVCLYVPVSDLGVDLLSDFMTRFAEKYQ
jgi:phosphoserine aminotransferase